MDVHGPPTRLSNTCAGLSISMQRGSGSRRQSSSKSTRDTFEDSGGDDEEDEAEEIGLSQLEDAPFTQPSHRQHVGSIIHVTLTLHAPMLLVRARVRLGDSKG
jgi:hypothetical protein